jgi:tetratricopeptide (TPR) repeat protein
MTEIDEDDDPFDPELDELERLSNSVVDLIESGRFDDAERACLELERRYPDQIDGLDRMAMVYEARGRIEEAIEWYGRCLDFIEANPGGFDEESKSFYRTAIDRLRSR